MSSSRVTLGQIAARAGVHVTTVSLALRGSLKLPAATRDRLRALADEMGYRPDPALNALNAYRGNVRSHAYQATVAWFNNYPRQEELLRIPSFRDYHTGMCERADELGYKLEEIWMHEPGLTPDRLRKRLQARGIAGIILFPQKEPADMPPFAWEEFSAVSLGYSVTSPQLHRVTNHQFRSALILLRELRALGYRRIGLYLPEEYDRRVNLGPSSAYTAYDRALPQKERVPILVTRYRDDSVRIGRWLVKHRPEVVISQHFRLWDLCLANGLRVPDDVGLAYLHINKGDSLLSGIYQSDRQIGRAALDLLVAMLHRNERGVPAIAQHVLIDGEWVAGKSTRRVGPPAPWFLDKPITPLQDAPAPKTTASTKRGRKTA
ncbi:MAG: LacI family DNA-binding transcriptional regulator [Opitutaceae bacterium]|jgi:LacI family transcriptional regulator